MFVYDSNDVVIPIRESNGCIAISSDNLLEPDKFSIRIYNVPLFNLNGILTVVFLSTIKV